MLLKIVCLLLAINCLAIAQEDDFDEFDPYIDIPFLPIKTSQQRIAAHGYPAESHFVETEDNYVLNLFRIPYSPKLNNANERKPVVFIQHGLFSCSDCFLLNGPENAIAYNFADAGYDVWLGNARGNIYSRNNTRLSLQHPYFWRFSWHEIGAIDLPAMIDYVLEKTGETALHYVGHSQGCTVFFVMTSERPEYNAKIKTAHMLAPPVFMGNATDGLIVGTAPYVGTPGVGARILQNQVFIPQNPFLQRLLDTMCSDQPLMLSYCKTIFLLYNGPEAGNLNTTLLPQLAETHPAGISSNQGIHFVQSYVSNQFRRYDWGPQLNLKAYGQEVPPSYDLSKITCAMYLYYGLNDGSANPTDISRLPEHLSNLKLFHEVPDPTWGHLDFIFAMQVKEVINDKVLAACVAFDEELASK